MVNMTKLGKLNQILGGKGKTMKKKLISLFKLISIIYLIIFLPKIISYQDNKIQILPIIKPETMIGIQNLTQAPKFEWIKTLKLVLVSNDINEIHTTKNKNVNLLLENSFDVRKIFVPMDKKNYDYTIEYTDKIVNTKKADLPILKWNIKDESIPRKHIATYDAILFDMINSGLRHDLCFSTLIKTLQTGAKYNKRVIILDRPNPLGRCMEGPGRIPLRPGITTGELAFYLNKHYLKKPTKLTVIPLVNWIRTRPLSGISTKNFPSNIKGINSCYGYSFLSLLNEISPINVGNNTRNAFEMLLFPPRKDLSEWEVGYMKKLCFQLGIFCRNYSFWDDKKKTRFNGVKFRIKKDINNFSAFNTLLTLIRFLKNRKNIQLSYSNMFDNMIGSSDVRKFLQDHLSFKDLKEKTERNLNKFYQKAKSYFLYKPFPQIKDIEIMKS